MGQRILILLVALLLSACGSGGGDTATSSATGSNNTSSSGNFQGLRTQASLSAQNAGDYLHYLLFLPNAHSLSDIESSLPGITVADNRNSSGIGFVNVSFVNVMTEDNLTLNGDIEYEVKVGTESSAIITSEFKSFRVTSSDYAPIISSSYDSITYTDLETIAVDFTLDGKLIDSIQTEEVYTITYESLVIQDHLKSTTVLFENIVQVSPYVFEYNDYFTQGVSGKLYVGEHGYVDMSLDSNGYYTLAGANQSAFTYQPVPHPQKILVSSSWDNDAASYYSAVTSETVVNTPPRVVDLSFYPEEIYESDSVELSFSNIIDDEGDAFHTTVKWYVDGALLTNESGSSIASTYYSKGQKITASLDITSIEGTTSTHTKEITVGNHQPSVGWISLYPYDPTQTSDLEVSYNSSDWDDSTLTHTFQWYVDDVLLPGETASVLPSGNASKGQVVKVTVTASDGVSTGLNSKTTTIGNSNPVIVVSDLTLEQDSLVVTVDATASYDPDGDEISFAWTHQGQSYNPIIFSDQSSGVIQVTLPSYGDYTLELVVTDESGGEFDFTSSYEYVDITIKPPALFYAVQSLYSNEKAPAYWYLKNVVTGDITNDGLKDIVAISNGWDYNSNAVTISKQTSTGIFEEVVSTYDPNSDLHDYSVGKALALLDVNQDGLLDVVVSSHFNAITPKIHVLYQTNEGGLAHDVAPASFDVNVAAQRFRTGDFNNDGLDDLVAIVEDSSIYVFPQLAGGGLGSAIEVSVPAFVSDGGPSGISISSYNDLEVGDLNGDGLMDVVVGSPLIAFVQTASGLQYAWSHVQISPIESLAAYAFEDQTEGVGVGDINDDGMDDIVVGYGGNSAYLAVFKATGGASLMDTPYHLVTNDIPEAVDIGDVNGDGLDDIVVNHLTTYGLGVHLQNGNNEFDNVEFLYEGQDSLFGVHSLAVSDLNGDNKADVVTLDQYTGIRVNLAK